LTFPSHSLSYPLMKSCRPDATSSRSCRLGPYWVTVEFRGGKVARVALGEKGARDDRKLAKDLERVLAGGRVPGYFHVDTTGLPGFTRKVLGRCAGIRPGQVMTYSELALAAGSPRGVRAAGQVMANNPFALLIPCHRVIGADQSLHGFGGGLDMKEWLLAREGWQFEEEGRARRLKSKSRSQEPRAKTVSRKRAAGKLGD
jgi:methylated-DNA-[protein]-cysteine S-methyltransferase